MENIKDCFRVTKKRCAGRSHLFFVCLIVSYYLMSVYLISSLSEYLRFSPPIPQINI